MKTLSWTALIALCWLNPAMAQPVCKVLDPELAVTYSGGCKDGLAEGAGEAKGLAEYHGEFKAGWMHGKGVKSWPNGDRYEGEFVEGKKEGTGKYAWGPGTPWAGQSYEGGYLNDMRHGFGTYRWSKDTVYSGAWKDDQIDKVATPMMLARLKFEQEAYAALSKTGTRACREMRTGPAEREWIKGIVVDAKEGKIAVRIDEPGTRLHIVAGAEVKKGEVVWEAATEWVPCY